MQFNSIRAKCLEVIDKRSPMHSSHSSSFEQLMVGLCCCSRRNVARSAEEKSRIQIKDKAFSDFFLTQSVFVFKWEKEAKKIKKSLKFCRFFKQIQDKRLVYKKSFAFIEGKQNLNLVLVDTCLLNNHKITTFLDISLVNSLLRRWLPRKRYVSLHLVRNFRLLSILICYQEFLHLKTH